MFELMVEDTFDAAHCLRGYAGSCDRLHGHTYRVQCVVRLSELDSRGIGVDFRDMKKALADTVKELDHEFLNDLPAFEVENPTAENLAKYIFERMKGASRTPVARITVWETANSAATYFEED
jgi:6-pyruvoyltetrahydropterin/6-carboxytetrahydropterin synthase